MSQRRSPLCISILPAVIRVWQAKDITDTDQTLSLLWRRSSALLRLHELQLLTMQPQIVKSFGFDFNLF